MSQVRSRSSATRVASRVRRRFHRAWQANQYRRPNVHGHRRRAARVQRYRSRSRGAVATARRVRASTLHHATVVHWGRRRASSDCPRAFGRRRAQADDGRVGCVSTRATGVGQPGHRVDGHHRTNHLCARPERSSAGSVDLTPARRHVADAAAHRDRERRQSAAHPRHAAPPRDRHSPSFRSFESATLPTVADRELVAVDAWRRGGGDHWGVGIAGTANAAPARDPLGG